MTNYDPGDWRAELLDSQTTSAETVGSVAEYIGRLTAQRGELLTALLTFGKHKPGCASGWRAATGSSQIGTCDCGLGAAIAKANGRM